MKRPGEHDTLIKIGTLGGGGMGIGAHLQHQANENEKIDKSLQKTKDEEAEWQAWKAKNEKKKKEIDKIVVKRKLKKQMGNSEEK